MSKVNKEKRKELSESLEKFTDWESFQSLISNIFSPIVEINSGVEADKAACDFTTLLLLRIDYRQIKLYFQN
jgi:hypothetical protein